MNRSRPPTSTNDIGAGLAAAPSSLESEIHTASEHAISFYTRLDLLFQGTSQAPRRTSVPRGQFYDWNLSSMGDSSAKKRKRAPLEAEDLDLQHRQKTRIVEDTATNTATPGNLANKKSTKDGKSRQEKSERRSSKKQKKRTADASPADEASGDNLKPKPERAHKERKKSKIKTEGWEKPTGSVADDPTEPSSEQSTREMVNTKSTGEVNNTSPVPAPATGKSLRVTNGTSDTSHQKKSRTKVATTQGVGSEVPPNDSTAEDQSSSKPQRFILFIGNLPYSATTPQIKSHFSKLAPTSIRHSTDKSTGRSKGFAFLEFAGYDKMKTCLKLYHHSIFDPEESKDGHDKERKDKKRPGRRINVELTVGGGGGRSEKRKEKIKGKNLKLEEERERRRIKELEDAEKAAERKPKNPATDANATSQTETESNLEHIHPSRRGRVG